MKNFTVRYNGLWMGGVSVVFAESEEEAIKKVEAHPMTIEFTDVQVEENDTDGVVYNDNGDY